ncbi:hypothetical protein CLV62_12652 [Dysgonomonas alginatilytica]|uniref:DUF6268 domain-containing protein n=1 Tax=Dysgonomonas alginatilytica TaxID=1605892 RepID=A0A2V3PS28_9BACT|nr:DUF6268 family outer membrane beta-barrel protein [Dysgonomonas alginatilytica]PXV61118.1 hypothetical protein CLV62_12652 [Dysgonomonas alginatilytica]
MKLLLIYVFISVVCIQVDAQISFKTEYFGKSNYRIMEGDTDEKVGDSKGSAMVYQGGINLPLSIKINENNRPTVWGINAGGAYASLNNKNFTEDLVLDEIMNLGLSIYHMRPLNDKWSLMASIGAGIYAPTTRFSQIGFKNVLASGGVIFIRHLKPNLDLGGGIAVNNSFGFPMVFPALYLNWTTQGNFAFKVSMLEGLEISAKHNFSKYFSLSLIAEVNGQLALVEKDGKDKMFSHQYIVGGLRPEIKIGKNLSIPLTAGINAMRLAEFSDRSFKGMFQDRSYYFQISPYASAGLQIGF